MRILSLVVIFMFNPTFTHPRWSTLSTNDLIAVIANVCFWPTVFDSNDGADGVDNVDDDDDDDDDDDEALRVTYYQTWRRYRNASIYDCVEKFLIELQEHVEATMDQWPSPVSTFIVDVGDEVLFVRANLLVYLLGYYSSGARFTGRSIANA
jgi:hypothetical protein